MKPFEENDRYVYDLTPDSVVLDCGGYEGRWTAGIFEKYGCHVYVLEPITQFFDNIAKRFSGNPKIHLWNYGISMEGQPEKFSIKGDMTGRYADNPEMQDVLTFSPQQIFGIINKNIDLMKLNVEGAEFGVIEMMTIYSPELIKRVRNLQVQWHSVVPDAQSRYDALQKKLAETHHLTFDHGWVLQNWERNQ